MHRRRRTVLSVLLFVVAATALAADVSAQPLVLSLQGDQFHVNGRPRFLFFISYFDALDVPDATLDADFAYLRNTVGVDGIRIFPNWWACVGFACSTPCPTCTLMDGNGNLNNTQLNKLRTVVDKARQNALLVDVSFAWEVVETNGLTISEFKTGLRNAAQALRGYDHIIFDLQNEWNNNRLSEADITDIAANYVRPVDPSRILVASVDQNYTATAVADFVTRNQTLMDAAAWHEPRTLTWYDDTDDKISALRAALGTLQKPIYFQEPQRWDSDPVQSHYQTAIRNAKSAGAAAWTFHTRTSFDMNAQSLQSKLNADPAQKATVESLRTQADAVGWGPGLGDGLRDPWQTLFGGTGPDGADDDIDGRTNATEFAEGTHPKGTTTRYLAEGNEGTFFDAFIALGNPNATGTANVLVRFLRADGGVTNKFMTLGALRRATLAAEAQQGLVGSLVEFSTAIEADVPIVADRTMSWDGRRYGSHAEVGVSALSTSWFLAEGATHSSFDLYYLFQNPGSAGANVTVTYLLPAGNPPIVKTYPVAGNSRRTVEVKPEVGQTDVSASITSDRPILVERAMYLNNVPSQSFNAGHDSAAVPATSTSWFLAEGATGSFFDLFILVANPNSTEARIRATYLKPNGSTVVRDYTVAANSRYNIWVDLEDPQLADTAVSTRIDSLNGVPVVAERAMWWPQQPSWHEGHNSPGSTTTGTRWAMAEGEVSGAPYHTVTYILIANTSTFTDTVRVKLFFPSGATVEKTFSVAGNSRFNVDVGSEFGSVGQFGAVIESLGGGQIVVERAMYSNDINGVTWAAGTNSLTTKLQ